MFVSSPILRGLCASATCFLSLVLFACDPATPAVAAPDAGSVAEDAAMLAAPDAASPAEPDAALTPEPDAGPRRGFREPCARAEDCASGLCLTGPGADFCSRTCDGSRPNDCRAERTLCVDLSDGSSVCFGPDIDTGVDEDDAVLGLGDCVTRSLRPLGADVDLFQIRADFDGALAVTVQPESGVDVRLEIYDGAAELVARQNVGAEGALEGIRFTRWTSSSVAHVYVFDAGSSVANSYRVCVEEATSD